jgi:hypothetical protein
VKFAIPLDAEATPEVRASIARLGVRLGFTVAPVASSDTRVHMIDQVFFRVAEHVPWRDLSREVIRKLAREAGYSVPPPSETPVLAGLAEANGVGHDVVMMDARRWIERGVFRQQALARDFRVAMTHLCLAELAGGPDGETTIEVITDWLTGRNRAVAAVRPYQIYSRISRPNARHLLESMLHWIRYAGAPGLIILLDIGRLTIARNPRDQDIFYT